MSETPQAGQTTLPPLGAATATACEVWEHPAVSVNRTRSLLYSLARFPGDYRAVKRGRVGKRIANKVIGRSAARLWR